jgi:hypothetical protein
MLDQLLLVEINIKTIGWIYFDSVEQLLHIFWFEAFDEIIAMQFTIVFFAHRVPVFIWTVVSGTCSETGKTGNLIMRPRFAY